MVEAYSDVGALESPDGLVVGDQTAIAYLRRRLIEGANWFPSMLEAMRLWRSPEEVHDGRYYRYLYAGEAFDYVTLAERLFEEVADLLPEDEVEAFLFSGRPPVELPAEEFRRLLGTAKYRCHLNYVYGVTVEEALQLAVLREFQKELACRPWPVDPRTVESVHERIYGKTETALLKKLQTERGLPHHASLSLSEYREFIYWLFKYRIKSCDRAKIASDTRKALKELQEQRQLIGMPADLPDWEPPSDEEVIEG